MTIRRPRGRRLRPAILGLAAAAAIPCLVPIHPTLALARPTPALARPTPALARESSGEVAPKDEPESAAPRDPNETPFLEPPYGQARLDGRRRFPSNFRGRFHKRRRFQLTVKPLFASIRTRFLGRGTLPQARSIPAPIRGGGAGIDLDVHIWRSFWLRATGTYSAHPVKAEFTRNDDDELVQTARQGVIHTAQTGAGVAYAFDVGRVLPLIELGMGAIWFRSPRGELRGQLGAECLDGGVCDTGLSCSPTNECQLGTTFEVHAGVAVDVQITHHLALGAGLRYFAFLSDPSVYPVYLQFAGRMGIWF